MYIEVMFTTSHNGRFTEMRSEESVARMLNIHIFCLFDQLIILHYCARHFHLKKWTQYTVLLWSSLSAYKLQTQQKSDPAKSGSGRILGIGYPNQVSGRKSISVHPYLLVINTNLPPILHHFPLMADNWSNFR